MPVSGNHVPKILWRARKFEVVPKNVNYIKISKQKVGDTSDEMVGMTDLQISNAKAEWEKECLRDSSKKGKAIPAYIYRLFRERPLLTISFIGLSPYIKDSNTMMNPNDIESKLMVAVSLSFPDFDKSGTRSENNTTVVYRLNKVAMEELYGVIDEDDDDD